MKRIAALLTALLLLAALLTACAKTGSQSGSFFNRGETKAPAATEPKPSEAPSATLPSGVQAVEQTTEPTLPTAPTVPTAPAETDPNGSDPVNLAADVVGTYRLSEFNGMDIREFYTEMAAAYGMSLEELDIDLEELANSVNITLNADGTAAIVTVDENGTGTWEQRGSVIAITVDGETEEFTYENGVLRAEEDGVTYGLSKAGAGTTQPVQPPQPTQPTQPLGPIDAAAVPGTYKMAKINGMDIREFYTEIAAAYGMSLEDLGLDLDEITESFVIVLQADGTATVISDEEEETGSWRVENNMVAIEVDGETLMFLFQDGEITFEEDEMTVTLRK